MYWLAAVSAVNSTTHTMEDSPNRDALPETNANLADPN
jgi:hypothetical protein